MKIMYFMDNSQILGGAAHTLLRQAELMHLAGHDVVVVVDHIGDGQYEAYMTFCLQRNIETMRLPMHVVSQPEDINIPFVLEHFKDTQKKIEEEKPDILHSVQINTVAELVARELNIPHIMDIYQALPDFFKTDYMNIFPKYHICDSKYYADMWEKYFHTDSVCIRTVADRGKRNNNCLGTDQVIKCICVGAVYKQKNQLAVIMACHKAIRNGIRLSLSVYGNYAGNPYGEECIEYIQAHALESYIELKGFCDNMPEVYQESDVLICGSTRESYPNVISEALANALVVISTPVAGVPEVIQDRQNGYLCKGYTSDAIYEKIVELKKDIEDGTIREILGNAAITYEKVHSPESVSAKLEQYYQWILDNFESKKTVSFHSLKKDFEEILCVYYENEKSFSDREKVKSKLWYLYHIQNRIKEQIKEKKNFFIWGTGKYGKVVYELISVYFENMKIAGFVDSYNTGQYMKKSIYKPKEVLNSKKNVILVATVNGQSDIINQLEKNNKQYIEDYYILSKRWW